MTVPGDRASVLVSDPHHGHQDATDTDLTRPPGPPWVAAGSPALSMGGGPEGRDLELEDDLGTTCGKPGDRGWTADPVVHVAFRPQWKTHTLSTPVHRAINRFLHRVSDATPETWAREGRLSTGSTTATGNLMQRDSNSRTEEEGAQLELTYLLEEARPDVRWDVHLPATTSRDLERHQEDLLEGLPSGTSCPCCGRYARIYARKLNSGMTAALLWAVRTWEARRATEGFPRGDLWIEPQKEAPRHVLANRELGRLALWDLLEGKPNEDDPDRRRVGLWRPTELGIRFARADARVPARVYVWDGRVIGRSREQVHVLDALGDRFSYEELMGDPPEEVRHG